MRVPVLALVLALTPVGARAADEDHPEMRAALREIENAQRHLEAAKHDYHGHRPAALAELRQAEEQVRKGLEKPPEAMLKPPKQKPENP